MSEELSPLEAWKIIKPKNTAYYGLEEYCHIVETTLENYEILKADYISMRDFKYDQLDAFDIIKKKRVNVRCLMSGWNLGKYNSYKTHIPLTQEEYDLLKEILQ